MKNLLRAPGRKKIKIARLCLNKRVTHTYLQAAFGFLPKDSLDVLSRRGFKQSKYSRFPDSSTSHVQEAPFDFAS